MASESSSSFQGLIDRLHAGDQNAAAEVFCQYSGRLVSLANRKLDSLLRQKLDPEDVVQSVFRSLFRQQAAGQLVLHDREHLWALLVTMTLRKCGRKLDYFHAARRDVRQEVSLATNDESFLSCLALAREPTPDEVVALSELVEQMMEDLDGRDRDIVNLALQNHTVNEIKTAVGCSERTVFRVMERVKSRLRKQQLEDT